MRLATCGLQLVEGCSGSISWRERASPLPVTMLHACSAGCALYSTQNRFRGQSIFGGMRALNRETRVSFLELHQTGAAYFVYANCPSQNDEEYFTPHPSERPRMKVARLFLVISVVSITLPVPGAAQNSSQKTAALGKVSPQEAIRLEKKNEDVVRRLAEPQHQGIP
jgi:hypothetical protein